MAMIKHNYPQSQHQGMTPVGSTFAPEPTQSNQQQTLANVLRRPQQQQQQFTEEEKAIIMQLMQQGATQEQAVAELMRMKSGG